MHYVLYLDVLAVQRVGMSGIKNIVAMPLIVQNTMPANLTQLNETLSKLNIQLKPFVLNFISSLAKCTNANYTICTEVNSDIFLSEFLNKINSEKLYSCERQYNQRFDIKLQQCMLKFEDVGTQTNHFLFPIIFSICFWYASYF
jgi:hypothetical protein